MSSQKVIKLQDPKSLFVVGAKGQLRQLFVPFRVQCIQPLEHIPAGTFVFVEGIFLHRKYRLLYWINQRLYPYQNFRIELFF